MEIAHGKRDIIPTGLMCVAYALSIDYIGGPSNVTLMVACTLLVLGCGIKLWRATGGSPVAWSAVHTALSIYVVLLIALIYTSTLPSNTMHFAWLFAMFAMVFLIAADLEDDAWKTAFGMFAITGLLSALWGLAEFFDTHVRASGPIVDASGWGAINNLFFFAMSAAFLTARRYVVSIGVALFVFAFAAFTAYSRVGNVIFVAALSFVVVICFRQTQIRWRLIALVVISIVAFGLINSVASLEEPTEHSEGYSVSTDDVGWSQRFALWEGGIAVYKEFPILGSGLGTFKVHYPRHRTSGDMRNLGNFVHNDYIELLAEGGLPMMTFVCLFLGILLHGLVKQGVSLASGKRESLEPVLLIVAMGTVLTHALMNFPLFLIQVQMLLALLFARYVKVAGFVAPRTIEVNRPSLSRAGMIGIFSFLLGVAWLDALSTELALREGRIPFADLIWKDPNNYLGTMSFLASVRPQNATNRFAMATIYRTSFDNISDIESKQSLGIAAALEYEAGLQLNPYQDKIRLYYAQFLEQNPWLEAMPDVLSNPEQLLREGVRIYPVYVRSQLDLADYLVRHGRGDEAYRILVEDALPWIKLRHDQTFYQVRHELGTTILREASARNDRAVLETLLDLY